VTTATSKASTTSPKFQDDVSSLQEEDHDGHLGSLDNKEDGSDSVAISQMEGGDSTPPPSKRKEHPSASPETFRKMRKVRRKPILEYHDLNISKWWRRMERESFG
jgi:hypothetical protein